MELERLKQIEDAVRAAWQARALERHDRWTTAELEGHQQRKLDDLVRHAAKHSPFYRGYYRDLSLRAGVDLQALPVTNKQILMDNFDRVVTDPRLKRESLEDHLRTVRRDSLYLGEYRVLATTGTTGRRGIFVYDRPAWRTVLANAIRWQRFLGARPRLTRRLRICTIGADNPAHVSWRIPASGNVGLFTLLHLDAALPVPDLAARLGRFQPQILISYPSIAALLAEEQSAGRLKIHPEVISTHSEALTEAVRRSLRAAWDLEAFDHYGLTEEPHVACECAAHSGLHLFEDLCLIEVLDEKGAPAAPGEPGVTYLMTNLYNRVQPLIRYEVTDMIAVTGGPCACGRPFARITEIAGRREETLLLRDAHGNSVIIPPIILSACLDAFSDVVEYALHHSSARIAVTAVPRPDADRRVLRRQLVEGLTALMRARGAEPPPINVEFCERIQRRAAEMGKLRRVRGGES